jgi:hypothetical protein
MMEIISMARAKRENIEERPHPWGHFHPMPLVYTICTEMCGNGVKMSGMRIMRERPMMAVLG